MGKFMKEKHEKINNDFNSLEAFSFIPRINKRSNEIVLKNEYTKIEERVINILKDSFMM